MDLKNFTLDHLFRYFFAGGLAAICFRITEKKWFDLIEKEVTPVSSAVLIGIVGATIYVLYRGLFYPLLVFPKSWLRWYRADIFLTDILEKVPNAKAPKKMGDADRIVHVALRHLNKYDPRLGTWAAEIHYALAASFVFFVASIWSFCWRDWKIGFLLLVPAVLLLIAGLLNQSRYRHEVTLLLLSCDEYQRNGVLSKCMR